MKLSKKPALRDWMLGVGFFVLSILIHLPFRSQYVYHWDGAEFSLAVEEYNVGISQPHPPGYFLYIMMGRIAHLFVSDPHASMVWVSIICGGLLSVSLFVLGKSMFSERAGTAAALIAMTSPQVWFHSSVALMYVVDAFLVTTTIYLCWRALQSRGSWSSIILIGFVIGIVGGVRQQTVLLLVPLLLFTYWKIREQAVFKLFVTAIISLVVGLTWFLPMVQLSGGWESYWKVVRLVADFVSSETLMGGGGWDVFVWNVFFTGAFCWDGLVLGVFVIFGALLFRSKMSTEQRQSWNNQYGLGLNLIMFWVLPMMAFGIFVAYTLTPGHIFSYLPGILLLVGVIISSFKTTKLFVTVTVILCLSNAFVFLAWPSALDGLFFHVGRTAREIRDHDDLMANTVSAIRLSCKPSEALVCHAKGYYNFGFRLFQIHLPEFDHFHLKPDKAMAAPEGKPMLAAINGKFEFVKGLDIQERKTILLMVPPDLNVEIYQPYFDPTNAEELEGSKGRVFTLPAKELYF